MITAALIYLVLVYVGAAAYIVTRPAAPRSTPTYVVRTTWTDKTHTTADYMDAWDWVKQYANVDCQVWINDDMAQDFKPEPRITDLGALLKAKLKTMDIGKWEPEERIVTPPKNVVTITLNRRQAA